MGEGYAGETFVIFDITDGLRDISEIIVMILHRSEQVKGLSCEGEYIHGDAVYGLRVYCG